MSCFFLLCQTSSLPLCTVFDVFSSNIDEVLPINPSANAYVYGDFNVHHKGWLNYSGGPHRPGELCYNFYTSNDLTQMVNVLLGSLTVTPIVLLFWIYLFLLNLVFALQWLSLHWEIIIMLLSQFSLTFHETPNECPLSSHSLWLFLCWLVFLWECIFKLNASAANEFCVWVQVGIDVYIPHCKYQVKPHSSPWFSAACAAAIVHRNHFFVCTKRINLLILK